MNAHKPSCSCLQTHLWHGNRSSSPIWSHAPWSRYIVWSPVHPFQPLWWLLLHWYRPPPRDTHSATTTRQRPALCMRQIRTLSPSRTPTSLGLALETGATLESCLYAQCQATLFPATTTCPPLATRRKQPLQVPHCRSTQKYDKHNPLTHGSAASSKTRLLRCGTGDTQCDGRADSVWDSVGHPPLHVSQQLPE